MYTIDSFTLTKIGEGTHHIYEAKNNTNQLEVYAVKRYPIGEDKRDVFYREAKALMRLKHENVVKLCGVATDLNTSDLYLFMPFYKIGTLQTWWKDPTSSHTYSCFFLCTLYFFFFSSFHCFAVLYTGA
eukprot:m.30856 g.30856  ORF g.30856 m.30856 type:complete len:129 (+) comp6259_c0_seq1:546-932(+)